MKTDNNTAKQASLRITAVRSELARKYPFFGKLLLRLKVRFDDVGTACTDGEYITFDLKFLKELSDSQTEFLMMHELMHCILKHCSRSRSKNQSIYNIACDIVVNSFILEILGITDFTICGSKVMHLAPDNTEGREHTAEQVYDMILRQFDIAQAQAKYGSGTDNHRDWNKVNGQYSSERWDKFIRDAAIISGGSGRGRVPAALTRYLDEVVHHPKTNWRQLLHDYILHDRYDYDFTVPDRRFQDEFILPSFSESIEGDTVNGLWLFVDASGSVSDSELAVLMKEIRSAYDQIEHISGKLSFFDSEVSEPISFESCDDLNQIEPVGGGGTSFTKIFQYLHSIDQQELPDLVMIFTDGWAPFPEEREAMNIPVIWLILDSDRKPKFGNTVYVFP